MRHISRREFLTTASIASAGALLVPAWATGIQNRPFEFLVVGDSLIWGQGLEEKDKFYTLAADWLRKDAFGRARDVNLKVKAHSGATIRFGAKEAEKYRAGGKDENHFYKGEVNVSTPSMWKQVETAAEEYKRSGRERGADLVMLTAGITDIAVEGVLDPFGDIKKLPPLIEEGCFGRVRDLLVHVAAHNPDAKIGVVGYFPILSPHSSRSKVFNGWLETLNVPGWLQPMANNPMGRQFFFKRLLKRAVQRSRIWLTESDRNLRRAVDALNAQTGQARAVFIPAPLTEEHAAEAPKTLLFRMRGNGSVTDPLYLERKADCKTAFDELRRTTGIKQSSKRCAIAAVGHPDPTASRLYADAIKASLGTFIR